MVARESTPLRALIGELVYLSAAVADVVLRCGFAPERRLAPNRETVRMGYRGPGAPGASSAL